MVGAGLLVKPSDDLQDSPVLCIKNVWRPFVQCKTSAVSVLSGFVTYLPFRYLIQAGPTNCYLESISGSHSPFCFALAAHKWSGMYFRLRLFFNKVINDSGVGLVIQGLGWWFRGWFADSGVGLCGKSPEGAQTPKNQTCASLTVCEYASWVIVYSWKPPRLHGKEIFRRNGTRQKSRPVPLRNGTRFLVIRTGSGNIRV